MHTPILIDKPSIFYQINPVHRGTPTEHKCVFVISEDSEVSMFKDAYDSVKKPRSPVQAPIWGVLHENGSLSVIGINVNSQNLYFGKFVESQQTWHGYPADYQARHKDKPADMFLMNWYAAKLIEKHEMRKIKRFQCIR